MKRIYKYSVPLESSFTLKLPEKARILCFQPQNGELKVWALVDADFANPPEEIRKFLIIGTGAPIHVRLARLNYIGTAQLDGLVWHLFEECCS
jgi:hypothetical protein